MSGRAPSSRTPVRQLQTRRERDERREFDAGMSEFRQLPGRRASTPRGPCPKAPGQIRNAAAGERRFRAFWKKRTNARGAADQAAGAGARRAPNRSRWSEDKVNRKRAARIQSRRRGPRRSGGAAGKRARGWRHRRAASARARVRSPTPKVPENRSVKDGFQRSHIAHQHDGNVAICRYVGNKARRGADKYLERTELRRPRCRGEG